MAASDKKRTTTKPSASESIKTVAEYYERMEAPPVIPYGVHFSLADIDKARQIPRRYERDIFERSPIQRGKIEYDRFTAEQTCSECGAVIIREGLSKQKVRDMIWRPEKYLCESCEQIKEREHERRMADLEQKSVEEIDRAIDSYLDPSRSWNKGITIYQKWSAISRIRSERFTEAALELEYDDFLQTPYWNAVSQKAKARANFTCQLCNARDNLHTHHRTYENHGMEHLHMKDLIVLCADCHKHFHSKEY